MDAPTLICSIAQSTAGSLSSRLWTIITTLWPWHWLWITGAIVIWVIFEILTRNGSAHYNSDNGFSPLFNSFVGSGTYLGLESAALLLIEKAYGQKVYCMVWPYEIHFLIFASAGLLLYFTGFWTYLEWLGIKKRKRMRH